MRTRDGKTYRRKPEAHGFRATLIHLRGKLGWNQEQLAAKLGVTARTLSSWENGYWLPPVSARLHVLLSLRDMPPEYVLAFADHLGLSADSAHDAFLQPFRDAVNGVTQEDPAPVVQAAPVEPAVLPSPPTPPPAPPPPAEPPRPRVDPATLRSAVDAVVREVSDALDARPNEVRAGIRRVLDVCVELGGTIEEAHEAIARNEGAKGRRA